MCRHILQQTDIRHGCPSRTLDEHRGASHHAISVGIQGMSLDVRTAGARDIEECKHNTSQGYRAWMSKDRHLSTHFVAN